MTGPVEVTPRFTYSAEHMPDWTVDAACRNTGFPGFVKADWFMDELAETTGDYKNPTKVLNALETCSTCPVQRECLEYAFGAEDVEIIRHIRDSDVPPTCRRCQLPLQVMRRPPLRWIHANKGVYDHDPVPPRQRRFGVFAVPGRMRERYGADPDRIPRLLAWLDTFAQEHHYKPRAEWLKEGVA